MTRYGLDVLGIESWWGRDFLHLSRLGHGPTQPLCSGCWVSFRGKVTRVWHWPPALGLCGLLWVELNLFLLVLKPSGLICFHYCHLDMIHIFICSNIPFSLYFCRCSSFPFSVWAIIKISVWNVVLFSPFTMSLPFFSIVWNYNIVPFTITTVMSENTFLQLQSLLSHTPFLLSRHLGSFQVQVFPVSRTFLF